MPLPTINDVLAVDPVLTNMLVGYMQEDNRFVADRVFPGVTVGSSHGTFYKFTKKYWFLDQMKPRSPGDPYSRAEMGLETDTFATLQYSLAYPLADETRADSQVPMDLEAAALRFLAQQNLIRKERAFSADFMKASVWGTDGSISAKWSDYSGSDPVADVQLAVRTVSNNTGYTPNTFVIGLIVRDRLVNHPDLIDRIKNTQAVTLASMDAALSDILAMPRILVGRATYNSANENATGTYGAIIDDDALVCYSSPTPGIFQASAGYTFNWGSGGGLGSIMPTFRDGKDDNDLLKMKAQWDQKAVATDLGYFFADCVD